MLSLNDKDLKFAQKYPFSATSKKIIKEINVSPDDVSREVIERAAMMIAKAAGDEVYLVEEIHSSTDLLVNEVLAFPVAKILISFMGKGYLNEQFANMISQSFLKYLEIEKNKQETLLDLAGELELKFTLSESANNGFFVSVQLADFLNVKLRDDRLKLVNQSLKKGRVYLDVNDFARFISAMVFTNIFNSLPVDTASVPVEFKKIAKQLQGQLSSREIKDFSFKTYGKINPNYFPPCMAEMYANLQEGKNIPHNARFYIAAFLAGLEMPASQIVELFKKTPNFNERTTRYQVERIAGKGGTKYTAPGCAKIREQKLCPSKTCKTSHPLSYYKRHLYAERKQKRKEQTQAQPGGQKPGQKQEPKPTVAA